MFFNTAYGQRSTQRRMKKLYEMGLVMRVRPKDLEPGTKPYIFAITELGYQVLVKVERISREHTRFDESEHQVEFSRVIHELHLNDICLDILEEAERRNLSCEWLPTKMCRQSIRSTDGSIKRIEPDAIFIFYTSGGQKVLHLEYERSADPRRFQEKLVRWKLYRGQQVWKERYQSEPFICVVGSLKQWETGGRKRRVVRSIQPLQQIARNNAFPKICFLPEDQVKAQTWNCLPDSRGMTKTLWEHLDL
jgi:hypothetical protein